MINAENIPVTSEEACEAPSRPSWKRANDIDKVKWYNDLTIKLNNLEIPQCVSQCENVHCQVANHKNTCDNFTKEVLDLMEDSCEFLPTTGTNTSN